MNASCIDVLTIMNTGFAKNIMLTLHDHANQIDNKCSINMMNSNNGSCIVIYLGMTMKMS